jgi:hypothetical protein
MKIIILISMLFWYLVLSIHNVVLLNRISKAIEFINKFKSIRAYFEYTDEDGYNEYDYETFRTELEKILKGEE